MSGQPKGNRKLVESYDGTRMVSATSIYAHDLNAYREREYTAQELEVMKVPQIKAIMAAKGITDAMVDALKGDTSIPVYKGSKFKGIYIHLIISQLRLKQATEDYHRGFVEYSLPVTVITKILDMLLRNPFLKFKERMSYMAISKQFHKIMTTLVGKYTTLRFSSLNSHAKKSVAVTNQNNVARRLTIGAYNALSQIKSMHIFYESISTFVDSDKMTTVTSGKAILENIENLHLDLFSSSTPRLVPFIKAFTHLKKLNINTSHSAHYGGDFFQALLTLPELEYYKTMIHVKDDHFQYLMLQTTLKSLHFTGTVSSESIASILDSHPAIHTLRVDSCSFPSTFKLPPTLLHLKTNKFTYTPIEVLKAGNLQTFTVKNHSIDDLLRFWKSKDNQSTGNQVKQNNSIELITRFRGYNITYSPDFKIFSNLKPDFERQITEPIATSLNPPHQVSFIATLNGTKNIKLDREIVTKLCTERYDEFTIEAIRVCGDLSMHYHNGSEMRKLLVTFKPNMDWYAMKNRKVYLTQELINKILEYSWSSMITLPNSAPAKLLLSINRQSFEFVKSLYKVFKFNLATANERPILLILKSMQAGPWAVRQNNNIEQITMGTLQYCYMYKHLEINNLMDKEPFIVPNLRTLKLIFNYRCPRINIRQSVEKLDIAYDEPIELMDIKNVPGGKLQSVIFNYNHANYEIFDCNYVIQSEEMYKVFKYYLEEFPTINEFILYRTYLTEPYQKTKEDLVNEWEKTVLKELGLRLEIIRQFSVIRSTQKNNNPGLIQNNNNNNNSNRLFKMRIVIKRIQTNEKNTIN